MRCKIHTQQKTTTWFRLGVGAAPSHTHTHKNSGLASSRRLRVDKLALLKTGAAEPPRRSNAQAPAEVSEKDRPMRSTVATESCTERPARKLQHKPCTVSDKL